jgi:hypothetical protein
MRQNKKNKKEESKDIEKIREEGIEALNFLTHWAKDQELRK